MNKSIILFLLAIFLYSCQSVESDVMETMDNFIQQTPQTPVVNSEPSDYIIEFTYNGNFYSTSYHYDADSSIIIENKEVEDVINRLHTIENLTFYFDEYEDLIIYEYDPTINSNELRTSISPSLNEYKFVEPERSPTPALLITDKVKKHTEDYTLWWINVEPTGLEMGWLGDLADPDWDWNDRITKITAYTPPGEYWYLELYNKHGYKGDRLLLRIPENSKQTFRLEFYKYGSGEFIIPIFGLLGIKTSYFKDVSSLRYLPESLWTEDPPKNENPGRTTGRNNAGDSNRNIGNGDGESSRGESGGEGSPSEGGNSENPENVEGSSRGESGGGRTSGGSR